MKSFQVIECMNPPRGEMRFEVIYSYSETRNETKDSDNYYFNLCYCKTQANAANICSAMNSIEEQTMSAFEEKEDADGNV